MDVGEDEPRDLHEGDDEGALGQGSQVVADGSQHGRQDWSNGHLGLLPSFPEEESQHERTQELQFVLPVATIWKNCARDRLKLVEESGSDVEI